MSGIKSTYKQEKVCKMQFKINSVTPNHGKTCSKINIMLRDNCDLTMKLINNNLL